MKPCMRENAEKWATEASKKGLAVYRGGGYKGVFAVVTKASGLKFFVFLPDNKNKTCYMSTKNKTEVDAHKTANAFMHAMREEYGKVGNHSAPAWYHTPGMWNYIKTGELPEDPDDVIAQRNKRKNKRGRNDDESKDEEEEEDEPVPKKLVPVIPVVPVAPQPVANVPPPVQPNPIALQQQMMELMAQMLDHMKQMHAVAQQQQHPSVMGIANNVMEAQ